MGSWSRDKLAEGGGRRWDDSKEPVARGTGDEPCVEGQRLFPNKGERGRKKRRRSERLFLALTTGWLQVIHSAIIVWCRDNASLMKATPPSSFRPSLLHPSPFHAHRSLRFAIRSFLRGLCLSLSNSLYVSWLLLDANDDATAV